VRHVDSLKYIRQRASKRYSQFAKRREYKRKRGEKTANRQK